MSKEAKSRIQEEYRNHSFCYLLPAQLFMDCHIFDHITMIRIRQCIT